jgi:lipopolysaccharide heptosyltransferase II
MKNWPDPPTASQPTEPVRYRYVRRRWIVLLTMIDTIGRLAAEALERLSRTGEGCTSAEVRRILVIQLDHLGDAILSTGMLAELARRWPRARIEVLAAPWNQMIFAAAPEVSQVHVWRNNRFARPARLTWPLAALIWSWWMRRRKFDLAIDVRGELPLALLMWLAGIPRRIGWAAGGGAFLLTGSPSFQFDRHELASRAALLDVIDEVAEGTNRPPLPRFEPTTAEQEAVAARLGDTDHKTLIVLHVAAGTPAKCWPVPHWQELLGRLIVARGDLHVVLIGTVADRPTAAAILGNQSWPGVENWTGELSIGKLAALIARASCFVGADSGPAQLAAAVGTPAVVLFSGTNDPAVWRPIGPRVNVLRHAVACGGCRLTQCPVVGHLCMSGITPNEVSAAVQQELARSVSLDPAPTGTFAEAQ